MGDVLVIGAGRMGLPILSLFVAAGHAVSVFDVRSDVRDSVVNAGARFVSTYVDALTHAASSSFVVTVLAGDDDVHSAMLGHSGPTEVGLLASMGVGTLWIDMSSVSPDVAIELADAASARSVGYVDAAIGGDPRAAQQGALRLYVGGEEHDVVRARELLQHLGPAESVLHVGGHGAGYLTKLLVNQLWFGQAVAVAEALALARSHGVRAADFADAIAGSAADSVLVRDYLPRLVAGDHVPCFELDHIVAQLDGLDRAASRASVPWAVSAAAAQYYRDTLAYAGPVDGELLTAARIAGTSTTRTTPQPEPHIRR